MGLLSFFTTGSSMTVIAPCLALALALTHVRQALRFALATIGLLTLVNLGLAIYGRGQLYRLFL